jgi:hypothetical protein
VRASAWTLAVRPLRASAGATVEALALAWKQQRGYVWSGAPGAAAADCPFSAVARLVSEAQARSARSRRRAYEDRRSNVVSEANAIGTTYLRAQTLAEPVRRSSLDLLVRYTQTAIRLSDQVPGSAEADDARADEERIEPRLWSLAGQALEMAPTASAPRLYVETLNEMIDGETVRVAALSNRVPTAVLVLEVLGSALALGLLAAYLAIVGRGVVAVTLASALVAFLLLVTADLDRPTRGMIRIPDTALTNQLASMTEPPAATAPRSPR